MSLNQISGELPQEIGTLLDLKYFYIDHNTIEGPLPTELKNLKKLEVFHINGNWIGIIIQKNTVRKPRQIPDVLQEMSSLWSFRIDQNYLLFKAYIEPIFSWSNFNNFTQFKYELQEGLHKDTELSAEKGKTVKIRIPNYFPASFRYICLV